MVFAFFGKYRRTASRKATWDKPTIGAKQTGKFILHKVEKKQTLYAITKKYNVGIDAIQKANPEIEQGLKEGMVLKIPQTKFGEGIKKNSVEFFLENSEILLKLVIKPTRFICLDQHK
jgi:hypothetical protein